MRKLWRDVLTFVGTCLSTWQAYLTGGTVQAIVNIYERERGRGISWETYRWGVFAFSIAAFFVIWRKENHAVEKLRETDLPDVSSLHEANTRLQNVSAHQKDEIVRLTKQVEILTDERPRVITVDQSRKISERLKAWPGYSEEPHMRRALVFASPEGIDAKNYASQISLALDRGSIWTDDVIDFRYGDTSYVDGEYAEQNRGFLKAHDANVTIWGSDETQHAGEPLDQAMLEAFRAADVEVVHHPGPTSLGGQVAIIVGRGAITQAARQQREIVRLNDEIKILRAKSLPRRLTDDQRHAIAQVVREGLDHLWETIKASPSWPADAKETKIFVALYAIENERETSVYRADFQSAFEEGGLGVALGEIVGTQGEPGNEQFVGAVSVLRGSPNNVVRPFVLKALQSAGIGTNECDVLPKSVATYHHGPSGQSLGVTLIIGQHE